MKPIHPDSIAQHHHMSTLNRRLEPVWPARKFSLQPDEPDAQPGDKLLGWIAALAIAGWLIYCALKYFKVLA